MPASHHPVSVPIHIRVKPEVRNLIDRAAKLLGNSPTSFMLELRF